MIYQPPAGARDVLPLEVAQKRWIEQRLQQTFHRWSYQQIITPTLERLETLMAGGAIQPETVMQFWDAEEGLLGLRPELTASIARAAVTRMAGAIYPQRLYYNANIFRRSPGMGLSSQQEFVQTGVELLGGSGLADGEILLLLQDCLHSLGLPEWHVVLGEAGLTRSLLSNFPLELQPHIRQAIARLDRVALTELPSDLRQPALDLLDLRGEPASVLQRLAQLDLKPEQRQIVHDLKTLLELVGDRFPLTLDLSLIQTFDYYTGIVFDVIATGEGEQRLLGEGGRYDQLLARYHPGGESLPGIGFALNLEDLHQVLLPTGQLPQQMPTSQWLIVPVHPEAIAAAFSYAEKLRGQPESQELRVEMALEWLSPEATREYARCRQITYIAWIQTDGSPQIEAVKG